MDNPPFSTLAFGGFEGHRQTTTCWCGWLRGATEGRRLQLPHTSLTRVECTIICPHCNTAFAASSMVYGFWADGSQRTKTKLFLRPVAPSFQPPTPQCRWGGQCMRCCRGCGWRHSQGQRQDGKERPKGVGYLMEGTHGLGCEARNMVSVSLLSTWHNEGPKRRNPKSKLLKTGTHKSHSIPLQTGTPRKTDAGARCEPVGPGPHWDQAKLSTPLSARSTVVGIERADVSHTDLHWRMASGSETGRCVRLGMNRL